MFGKTQFRTVELAAVRITEADDGELELDATPMPPNAQSNHAVSPTPTLQPHPSSPTPPVAPPVPPDGAGAQRSDHDGRTMAAAEVSRVTRARAAVAPSTLVLRSVKCPKGHPNPPGSKRCRECNAVITNFYVTTIHGLVPGVLVIDGTTQEPFDGPMIIGRQPRRAGGPELAAARLVTLASPEQRVSRNHAVVRVNEWTVTITDLGSANGTEVTLPGGQPTQLERGQPCKLQPGAVIRFGDEVDARYELP